MRRREFIAMVGGAAAAWPLAARAQQTRLVGVLLASPAGVGGGPAQANVAAFVEGLRDLGWIEGKNLRVETRWTGAAAERANRVAAELVALAPDVILSVSTANLMALQRATRTVPVVFVQVSDPVAQGFISTITRPGGNITGFSAYEFSIGGKWLELLKQIAPGLARVAVMFNPDTSPQSRFFVPAVEVAGTTLGVQVAVVPVHTVAEIELTIEGRSRELNGGLILPTDAFIRGHAQRIAELALRFRLPTICAYPDFIDYGGLLFYGSYTVDQLGEQYQQAASYVDRILKGAKAGDLPVQGPTKFELAINRKTATALGLEIPPRLLFTADRVIE